MKHSQSAARKVLSILLVVVLLTVTLGSGVASAATIASEPKEAPTLNGWWGLCNYTVRPGDTLYSIARRYGTTVWYLASVNGISNPNYIRSGRHLYVPCVAPAPPPPAGCYYRVRYGDTLLRIALRYGTSVWYLASINHIVNVNRIYAGTWLRVPCWDP